MTCSLLTCWSWAQADGCFTRCFGGEQKTCSSESLLGQYNAPSQKRPSLLLYLFIICANLITTRGGPGKRARRARSRLALQMQVSDFSPRFAPQLYENFISDFEHR